MHPQAHHGSNQTGTEVQTTQQQDVQTPEREPDVVYVPTPQEVVEEMLALAKVTKRCSTTSVVAMGVFRSLPHKVWYAWRRYEH